MRVWRLRREQEAQAERIEEPWGSLTWLAGSRAGGSESQTLARVVIRAGASNPRHYHAGCEEILHLLSGRLEHTVGGETVMLEPGDTLVIPRGLPHAARNVAEVDALMIVAYDSGSRDFHAA